MYTYMLILQRRAKIILKVSQIQRWSLAKAKSNVGKDWGGDSVNLERVLLPHKESYYYSYYYYIMVITTVKTVHLLSTTK